MFLCINLDHVATVRQARQEDYPSLIDACILAEKSGADGITLHLREDRRHIQDNDIYEASKIIKGKFTMEMASTDEMLEIAKRVKPNLLTLVPEKRQELTTEGGLNLKNNKNKFKDYISEVKKAGLRASFFIEPDFEIIEIAKELGTDCIEIHTGRYANVKNSDILFKELEKIKKASEFAYGLGLQVNVGHGLNKDNVAEIIKIKNLSEFHIGHAVIARAIFVGLEKAISEIKEQLK